MEEGEGVSAGEEVRSLAELTSRIADHRCAALMLKVLPQLEGRCCHLSCCQTIQYEHTLHCRRQYLRLVVIAVDLPDDARVPVRAASSMAHLVLLQAQHAPGASADAVKCAAAHETQPDHNAFIVLPRAHPGALLDTTTGTVHRPRNDNEEAVYATPLHTAPAPSCPVLKK